MQALYKATDKLEESKLDKEDLYAQLSTVSQCTKSIRISKLRKIEALLRIYIEFNLKSKMLLMNALLYCPVLELL